MSLLPRLVAVEPMKTRISGDFHVIDNHFGNSLTRKQVDALLKLGVMKESLATAWIQVHLVPKPAPEGTPQKWRFTIDFVRLNSATDDGLSLTFNRLSIGLAR
jgi:hypothetical protein